jgi:hypothetical protein
MTKEELNSVICKYYEQIYRKVMRYNDFAFVSSENQTKQINTFILLLDKEIGLHSIGKEWLFNFIIYLFKERISQKTRYKDKVPFNWIIGKKSFELYQKRSERWLYFNDQFIIEHNIRKPQFNTKLELNTDIYYETLRKNNSSIVMPLGLCLNEVPFKSKSKYCLKCVDKKLCKEINI